MKRLAWMTDVHLNFLEDDEFEAFADRLRRESFDVLAICGDIAESPTVVHYLRLLDEALQRPIAFVLGNHDYYRGAIAGTRAEVAQFVDGSPNLTYLNLTDCIELTPSVGMVGHDGWGDARLGNYLGSPVLLNDFFHIEELSVWRGPKRTRMAPTPEDQEMLREILRGLGDESAAHFARVLPAALDRYSTVVAVTHVPPFADACWHAGRRSDADWLPFFTCDAVGETLWEVMRQRPDRQLIVLCGHTHGGGEARLAPNIRVLTGAAEYGEPALQSVIELE